MDEQKSLAIDYIKCIGIILVVYGHFDLFTYGLTFNPYFFHMPLFFFLGGVLLNLKKSSKDFYKNIFFKYFLYIVFTYILLGLVSKFLHYVFNIKDMNIFEDGFISTAYLAINSNFHNNYFFLVAWFLFSYMLVLCLSYPILQFLVGSWKLEVGSWKLEVGSWKLEYSRIIILLLALVLGYIAIDNFALLYKSSKRAEINILVQVLVGSMYFYLGFLLKEYIWRILNPVIGLILFLVFVYLRRSNILLGQGMAWSYYPSGFIVTLIGTLICIYLVFLAADILSKYGRYELFRLIGKNSKSIMFFHLLAFTLVDLFLAKLGFFKMDLNNLWLHSKMAYAFPLNLCVSIIFSLAIGYCLKKCSNKIYG